jgi:hypothetical protein
MNLMYGKIQLMDGALKKRYPLGDAYQRMASALAGVERVTRIAVADRPAVFLFDVQRRGRPAMRVVWERRDTLSGEDQPATPFDCEWKFRGATARDALGAAVPVKVSSGRLHLETSLTPVFVEGRAN